MLEDFHKTPIYHYTSAPIDHFSGYTDVFFLKDRILKTYNINPIQWFGVEYWLHYAAMLLKRYNEKADLKKDHRDGRIWFDVIEGLSYPEQNPVIAELHLLLKQDNNGTMHLFTFHPLQIITEGNGYKKNDARHEFDCYWELDGVY